MKKSYHSSEVPTRLATMTRRTDEGCGVVPRSAGIGAPRDRFRSMLIQHKPDHVPAQQEATRGIRAEVAVRRSVRPSTTTSIAARGAEAGEPLRRAPRGAGRGATPYAAVPVVNGPTRKHLAPRPAGLQ